MKALGGKAFMTKGSNYKEVGKSGEMVSTVDQIRMQLVMLT